MKNILIEHSDSEYLYLARFNQLQMWLYMYIDGFNRKKHDYLKSLRIKLKLILLIEHYIYVSTLTT